MKGDFVIPELALDVYDRFREAGFNAFDESDTILVVSMDAIRQMMRDNEGCWSGLPFWRDERTKPFTYYFFNSRIITDPTLNGIQFYWKKV